MRRESIHDVHIPGGMMEKPRGSVSKEDGLVLQPTRSIDEVQAIEMQEGKHGQFHRSFTPRQVHVSQVIQVQPKNTHIALSRSLL
jgi:amino acid transporter